MINFQIVYVVVYSFCFILAAINMASDISFFREAAIFLFLFSCGLLPVLEYLLRGVVSTFHEQDQFKGKQAKNMAIIFPLCFCSIGIFLLLFL